MADDPSTLASDLRAGVAELSTLAAADLAIVWDEVGSAGEARDALLDVLPALIVTYGAASAALAAEWYDETRAASSAPGRFQAIPVDLGDAGASGLARWAVEPLFQAEPDWRRARVLAEGGLQKRIANASRETVAESAVQDRGAVGWQRVGDGQSCLFCLMLISRGAVYRESTARFASHEFCGCMAMPAFKGNPLPVKKFQYSDRRRFDADGKVIPISDRERQRVQDWIDQNEPWLIEEYRDSPS